MTADMFSFDETPPAPAETTAKRGRKSKKQEENPTENGKIAEIFAKTEGTESLETQKDAIVGDFKEKFPDLAEAAEKNAEEDRIKCEKMAKNIEISEKGTSEKDFMDREAAVPEASPAAPGGETVAKTARERILELQAKNPVENGGPHKVKTVGEPVRYAEGDVRSDLEKILGIAKSKYDVPTLVTYYSEHSSAYRHVIIDINDILLDKAWARWQETEGRDAEKFLTVVYEVTRKPVPRLYRAVATRRLCD